MMIGTSRSPTATVTNTISPVTASSRAVGQQFGTEPDLASCGGLLKSTMCSGLASRAFDLVNPTFRSVCTRCQNRNALILVLLTPVAHPALVVHGSSRPPLAGLVAAARTRPHSGPNCSKDTSVSQSRYLKWLPRTWQHSVGERYEGIRDRNEPPRISSLIGRRTVLVGGRWGEVVALDGGDVKNTHGFVFGHQCGPVTSLLIM